MSEMPDVATLTTISSNWGNQIRDRTIQRYSSVANRTSEHPTPSEGDLSYLEDVNAVEVYDGTSWVRVGPPAGAIEAYGGSSAPSGWLLCDGTAVSRTTYAALFSVLGTTYGAGNGSTTFNLPDLRQRFPLGKATSGTGVTLGSTGGAIDHSHSTPNHAHTIDPPATNTTAALDFVGGRDLAGGGFPHNHQLDIPAFNTSAGGGGTSGAGNPPFQVVNFIVKT